MQFLGIDHATSNYAYVILNDDASAILEQKNFKFKGMDFDAVKLFKIDEAISSISTEDIIFASLEGYAINAKFYREAMGEIGSINRLFLIKRAISFIIVSPMGVKFYHTGSGKSDKAVLRASLMDRFPNLSRDTNISDACALALIAHDVYKYITEGVLPQDKNKVKIIKEITIPNESKTSRKLYVTNSVKVRSGLEIQTLGDPSTWQKKE